LLRCGPHRFGTLRSVLKFSLDGFGQAKNQLCVQASLVALRGREQVAIERIVVEPKAGSDYGSGHLAKSFVIDSLQILTRNLSAYKRRVSVCFGHEDADLTRKLEDVLAPPPPLCMPFTLTFDPASTGPLLGGRRYDAAQIPSALRSEPDQLNQHVRLQPDLVIAMLARRPQLDRVALIHGVRAVAEIDLFAPHSAASSI
jgi:hypothetical protein